MASKATETSSIFKGSDVISMKCDACLTHDTTSDAVSFCSVCNEYLCQACSKVHSGSRATKDHTLLTGSKMPSESTRVRPTLHAMVCDIHKPITITLYCKTHKEVICTTCKVINHINCETIEISRQKKATNVPDTVRTVIGRLVDLNNKFQSLKMARQADKSSLKTQIQKCVGDLHKLRKHINGTLDKLEKKMATEIHDTEKKITKSIDDHVTVANDMLSQIGDQNRFLDECQKTQDTDVMFVGVTKASSRAREYEDILVNIQEEICPIDVYFEADDSVTRVLQQMASLGTVFTSPTRTSVLNMSIKHKEVKDVAPIIWGSTFLPDGHLVLGCARDGLKLFDGNVQFISQLELFALGVSAIDDADVIVTQGKKKQLKRVQILPQMVVKQTMLLDRMCWGVDVYDSEIYVTCSDNPGSGEVRVLNINGQVLKRLGVDDNLFTTPGYVMVSRNGKQIFVSDWSACTVTCINQHDHVMHIYSDKDLQGPEGMFIDDGGNLLVCGGISNNVHVVRADGRKEKILLSQKDGTLYPRCVLYRGSDGVLIVCLHQNYRKSNLILFKTE